MLLKQKSKLSTDNKKSFLKNFCTKSMSATISIPQCNRLHVHIFNLLG